MRSLSCSVALSQVRLLLLYKHCPPRLKEVMAYPGDPLILGFALWRVEYFRRSTEDDDPRRTEDAPASAPQPPTPTEMRDMWQRVAAELIYIGTVAPCAKQMEIGMHTAGFDATAVAQAAVGAAFAALNTSLKKVKKAVKLRKEQDKKKKKKRKRAKKAAKARGGSELN